MVEAIRQGDIPGVQLRYRQRLALTVEEAWRWLTEPRLLERWAADRVEVTSGETPTLLLERDDPVCREQGETLEREAGHSWSLAFRQLDTGWKASTRLTWTLAPTADGCELDVLQQGFEHLSLSTCLTVWEEYRRRWREASVRLAVASEARGSEP